MVVECGQHFARSAADLATEVTLRFLAYHGLIDALPAPAASTPARRFRLLEVHLVHTPQFAFTRPVIGFETFAKDELIAVDGDKEIRSPCDGCTIFMPTREPVGGARACTSPCRCDGYSRCRYTAGVSPKVRRNRVTNALAVA